MLVQAIPTTLLQRTFEQLFDVFNENDLPVKKLHAFFSMMQGSRGMHNEVRDSLIESYAKTLLSTQIPFASDIERMGAHRAPATVTVPNSATDKAYEALSVELLKRRHCA